MFNQFLQVLVAIIGLLWGGISQAAWYDAQPPLKKPLSQADEKAFSQAINAMILGEDAKAIEIFLNLAQKGDQDAQVALANLYERKKTPAMQKEALKWHWILAQKGVWRSEKKVGEAFMEGRFTQVDLLRAKKWLDLAEAHGGEVLEDKFKLAEKIKHQALNYYHQGDFNQAIPLLKAAAEETTAAEIYRALGEAYAQGLGRTTKNLKKAVRYYQQAADLGDRTAQLALAQMVLNGQYDLIDPKKARRYLQKAAEPGSKLAQYQLAQMYLKGEGGFKKDTQKAQEYLKLAAVQNYVPAQYELGVQYSLGKFVEKDPSEAFHWFKQAAKNGDVRSQYNLGVMYLYGIGIKPETQAAKKWLAKAAQGGNSKAQKVLQHLDQTTKVSQVKEDKTHQNILNSQKSIKSSAKTKAKQKTYYVEIINKKGYQWLMSLGSGGYLHQLMSGKNLLGIKNFVKKYFVKKKIPYLIYKVTDSAKNSKYVLQSGYFSGYTNAMRAAVAWKKKAGLDVWVRSVRRVQQNVRTHLKADMR